MIVPINILIDKLPESITVDGVEYAINSDFRTFILFEQLLTDESLTNEEKINEMISLIFPYDYADMPIITNSVIDEIVNFYKCGKKETKRQKAVKKAFGSKEKVYDFDYDAAYIYAAFMSQYGIDLNECDLHWWKFKALFNGLSSDCELSKIMGYRAIDIKNIKNKSEKTRILKMKAIYALPDNLTTEEKAARIGAVLGGGIR